jgi:phage-related protein
MSILSFFKNVFNTTKSVVETQVAPVAETVVETVKEEIVEIPEVVAEKIAEEAVIKPKKRYYKRKKK